MTSSTASTAGSRRANASSLIALLEKQQALFEQFHQFSSQQADFVASGQTESLLSVLASRQRLLDELANLKVELEPYRSDWQQFQSQLSVTQRQHVDDLLKQTHSYLQEVMEQDQRDQAALQHLQGQVGSQLQRAVQAATAVQAYRAKPATQSPRFTDRQG